jgi:hypothetical protein
MSIEAKTDQPIAVRPSNDAVIALPRIAIPTWRRRRYQVAAALIAVVVIAAFFANNFLVRQYSPEGAVRQYLGALQSGDSSTAWRLIQVTSGAGATLKLTDRSALEAALANGRPDIKSFAITGTTPVNASTSAVTFTYETSEGAKDGRFLVKRSAQNNLQIYPGWQLVVTPVDLQVSLPAGSGGVVIDGRPVAIDGKSVVAVLPLAHQVRFPGTRMVEAKTVAVDAFASQGAAVSYSPNLTPVGREKATAAIKTGFASCVAHTGLRPDGCPQSVSSSVVSSGQWQLVGDPSQNLAFSLDGDANLVGVGRFQMVFTFQERGVSGPAHMVAAGGFNAVLNLAADDMSVSSIRPAAGLPAIGRPAAATDQAALDIVSQALKACASVRAANPGACPQSFYFPNSSDFRWTLVTDPLLNARVAYDSATGVFTVKGSFDMKLNYKINGYPYTTYSNTTDYIAYLFWDGQQLVLVTIDGE